MCTYLFTVMKIKEKKLQSIISYKKDPFMYQQMYVLRDEKI